MAIPVAKAYSPKTITDGVTLIGAVVIVIDDTDGEGIDAFADASVAAPGEAVLCSVPEFNSEDPAEYESITYTERDTVAMELKGVTRAVEGTAREWPSGSAIASYTTADAWNKVRTAVNTNTTNIGTNTTGIGTLDTNKLNKSGGTMSGTLAMADQLITQPDIKDYCETLKTLTWDSDTQTINLQDGNVFDAAISVAVTSLTISNSRAGAHNFTLRVVQGGTLRDITYPVSVAWAGGVAPVMAINKAYWITFVTLNGGTNWTGFLAGEV